MNLFDVLSMGERIIVFSAVDADIIITWNQSATLQAWLVSNTGHFEEMSIRTCGREPRNFNEARDAAIRWHASGIGDDR